MVMDKERANTGTDQEKAAKAREKKPRVPPSQGKLLYHITHIDNLPSILEKGLLSREMLKRQEISFVDLSHRKELDQGEEYQRRIVKYVPFYFFATNPFHSLACRDPKTRELDSENRVIIAVYRSTLEKSAEIIPIQPTSENAPEIYSYSNGFSRINWEILDNPEHDIRDSEVKRSCLAECIVEGSVNPNLFIWIYVKSEDAKEKLLNSGVAVEERKISVFPFMFPTGSN